MIINKREEIVEVNPEALLMPKEFDKAIIGYVERIGLEPVAIYNTNMIIDIYIEQGMTEEEAIEYFWYNTFGSYAGEYTPMFATVFS